MRRESGARWLPYSGRLELQERFSMVLGSGSPIVKEPTIASPTSLWSRFLRRYLPSFLKSSSLKLTTPSSNWPSTSRSWQKPWGARWSEFRSSGIYGGDQSPPKNSWIALCEHLRELDFVHSSGTGQIDREVNHGHRGRS
jgi:hypothetical protein